MSNLDGLRAILREAKMAPCVDCKREYHYAVMDADHRDPDIRLFSLSRPPKGCTVEMFLTELAKCDIVCSNCHRMRTFRNGGFFPKKQKTTMGMVPAGSGQSSY